MNESCLEEERALSGLLCTRCVQPLSFVAGIRSLSFYCASGHSALLGTLIRRPERQTLEAFEELSLAWGMKLRTLAFIAAQAQADGYLELASTFNREIDVLQSRQAALWNALGAEELRRWRRDAVGLGA